MVPWPTFLRSMITERKPVAVRWYGSSGLFRQLRRIVRLSWEGAVIDARDWMQPNMLVYVKGEFTSQLDSARWKEGESDNPNDGAIWFDYRCRDRCIGAGDARPAAREFSDLWG